MFRRLFFLVLLALFLAVGALSAHLLYQHYVAWQACADIYGRCFANTPSAITNAAPMAMPLAYLSITFVLALLSLWALRGVLRRGRRVAA